jgi:hypothetical protein
LDTSLDLKGVTFPTNLGKSGREHITYYIVLADKVGGWYPEPTQIIMEKWY